MTRQQAIKLTELVQSVCPAQRMTADTPKTWYTLLQDLDIADCADAVAALARDQRFVEPSEIRDYIRRARRRRLEAVPAPVPPRELLDDPPAANAWLRAEVRRIADGPRARPAIAGQARAELNGGER